MSKSSNKKRRAAARQAPPPSLGKRLGAWAAQLARRAAWALLRFLWRQIKFALAVSMFVGAALLADYLHYFWPASILLWVAIIIAVCWAFSLLGSIFGHGSSDYSPSYDRPSKPRETWREREERDWQEMHDAYQREQEDRGHV